MRPTMVQFVHSMAVFAAMAEASDAQMTVMLVQAKPPALFAGRGAVGQGGWCLKTTAGQPPPGFMRYNGITSNSLPLCKQICQQWKHCSGISFASVGYTPHCVLHTWKRDFSDIELEALPSIGGVAGPRTGATMCKLSSMTGCQTHDYIGWIHYDESVRCAKNCIIGNVAEDWRYECWTKAPPKATCDTFQCNDNTHINKGINTDCSGTDINSCDSGTCCEAKAACSSFNCASGLTNKGLDVKCSGANAATCNTDTCCEACHTFAQGNCPTDQCSWSGGVCKEKIRCNTFTCGQDSVNKGAIIKCAGSDAQSCDSATCCDAKAGCDTFKKCGVTQTNKGATVKCTAVATESCDGGTCCEAGPCSHTAASDTACKCGSKTCPPGHHCTKDSSTCVQACGIGFEPCSGMDLCLESLSRCVPKDYKCQLGYHHHEQGGTACSLFKMQSFCSSLVGQEKKCLEGVTMVGQGFDFTKNDILKLPTNNLLHVYSLKEPVSEAAVQDKIFKVPLSVQVLKDQGQLDSTSSVEIENEQQARGSTYSKISGEAKYGSVEASTAATYDTEYSSKFKSGKKINEKLFSKKLFTVKLEPGIARSLIDPQFSTELARLPQTYDRDDQINKAKFQNFIAKFGTHYVSSITYGGFIKLIVEMSSCLSSKCGAQVVSAEACAKTDVGVNSAQACAELSNSKASCESGFASSTLSKLNIVGGRPDSKCTSDQCDSSSWAETVTMADSNSHVPIETQVVPLWNALGFGQEKQIVVLREALEDYVKEKGKNEAAENPIPVCPEPTAPQQTSEGRRPRPILVCLGASLIVFATHVK